MDVRMIYRTCPTCGHRFGQPDDPGRKRRFCSDACKQAAYRTASAPPNRPAGGLRRRPPAAPAKNTPVHPRACSDPPAAAPCWPQPPQPLLRGLQRASRGAHRPPRPGRPDRARRRYDGLHAKAASTGFPEEADACRTKAEQLRAKYRL